MKVNDVLRKGEVLIRILNIKDDLCLCINYSAESMAKAGRDVERQVLIRALSRVVDGKVFVHGNKTVVF